MVAALALLVALGVITGCAHPLSARPACADAILDDWTTGALRATYPADCYDAAIDALPEDLRAYTSAADDISRAAIAASRTGGSARQVAAAPVESETARALPLSVVLLTLLVTVVVASGVAASVIRHRRAR